MTRVGRSHRPFLTSLVTTCILKNLLHVNAPVEANVVLCDCNVDDGVARATTGWRLRLSDCLKTTSAGAHARIRKEETNNTISSNIETVICLPKDSS